MHDRPRVDRDLTFFSRDFMAYQVGRGDAFIICARESSALASRWWKHNAKRNYRHVFTDPHCTKNLVCADEVEAHALMLSMQTELNTDCI